METRWDEFRYGFNRGSTDNAGGRGWPPADGSARGRGQQEFGLAAACGLIPHPESHLGRAISGRCVRAGARVGSARNIILMRFLASTLNFTPKKPLATFFCTYFNLFAFFASADLKKTDS